MPEPREPLSSGDPRLLGVNLPRMYVKSEWLTGAVDTLEATPGKAERKQSEIAAAGDRHIPATNPLDGEWEFPDRSGRRFDLMQLRLGAWNSIAVVNDRVNARID